MADASSLAIGPCAPLWLSFVDEVNARGLSVLEIGARASVFGTDGPRSRFVGASEYVGLDINPGPGADLVGDVHALSDLLAGKRFGAIHSTSVMEHLAMPWVAAVEMIKSLEVGGIMFHHVPFAWPEHEAVDCWRMTRQAYSVLFPRAFGMEIEAIGGDHPLHMHMENPPPEQEHFHEATAYAYFGALMRKVADADLSAFRWPLDVGSALSGARY